MHVHTHSYDMHVHVQIMGTTTANGQTSSAALWIKRAPDMSVRRRLDWTPCTGDDEDWVICAQVCNVSLCVFGVCVCVFVHPRRLDWTPCTGDDEDWVICAQVCMQNLCVCLVCVCVSVHVSSHVHMHKMTDSMLKQFCRDRIYVSHAYIRQSLTCTYAKKVCLHILTFTKFTIVQVSQVS